MNPDIPHDEDAEKVLLGNCIITESAAPLQGIEPSLFYKLNHQKIASEIISMSGSGEPITLARLARRLQGKVSAAYVASLTDGMPAFSDLSFYRSRVIETAAFRRGAHEALALQGAFLSADRAQIERALRNLHSIRGQHGSYSGTSGIRAISLKDLLAADIKPRGMLLAPIIPEQGLAMLYSKRGVGKTHLALGMAVAVARGMKFLRWTAQSPQPVLYVDGELPASLLQKWVAEIMVSIDGDADSVGENLRIVTPDFQDCGIPDLSTREGQSAIEQEVREAKLVVIDNLSALCRSGNENEAEGWLPLQKWALNLRRVGKSVLFVHHAGHQGKNQRGTSKREDLLDTVIALRHPSDYNPIDGLRAEVHFEKTRHFHGEEAKPFTAALVTDESGYQQWVTRDLNENRFDKASRIFSEGLGVEDVMQELEVSRAQAFRYQKQWRESQVSLRYSRDSETKGARPNDQQH